MRALRWAAQEACWFRGGNANYAYNLNGGTLSIPAITWLAPGGGAGGGNGAVNLNGGLLQITSNAFIIPQDTGDNGNPAVVLNVVDGGARIDTYGNSVTFNAPLNHSSTGAVDGGLTLADSLGTGTLILTTTNGYNGPTTVSSGTLQLGTGSYGQDGLDRFDQRRGDQCQRRLGLQPRRQRHRLLFDQRQRRWR